MVDGKLIAQENFHMAHLNKLDKTLSATYIKLDQAHKRK